MRTTPHLRKIALLAAATLTACAAPEPPSDSDVDPGPDPAQTVTFHRDVLPILETACTNCHSPDGLAPFPLQTYAHARAAGALLRLRAEDRSMPPWDAAWDHDCPPPLDPAGDPLPWTAHLRADGAADILAAWEHAGFPEGDPADAPAPPAPPDPLAADVELGPKVPFPVGGKADLHRCFVLPAPAAQTTWVTGLEIVPGLPRAVHAASLYIDADARSDTLAGPDGDYPCFATAGIDGLAPIAAWTAGDPPWRLPAGTAFEIPSDARLVLQLHYHPGGQTEELDLTRLRLAVAADPPAHVVVPLRAGAPTPVDAAGNGLLPGPADPAGPELRVPAGARDHTESTVRTLAAHDPFAGGRVLAVAAHMHYSGTAVTVGLERADGPSCLLSVPAHRFDWERTYRFDADIPSLPLLSAGDRVTTRCTFDNSMSNPELLPHILAGPDGAPTDLVWGDTPLSEVCAATLLIVKPRAQAGDGPGDGRGG